MRPKRCLIFVQKSSFQKVQKKGAALGDHVVVERVDREPLPLAGPAERSVLRQAAEPMLYPTSVSNEPVVLEELPPGELDWARLPGEL